MLISTVLYALATVAGGNPVLVFAAADPRAGRRACSAGPAAACSAPVLTHITWSMAMLFVLPYIFR